MGDARNALITRDSRVTQIDYGASDAPVSVRALKFDSAGHFWPRPASDDNVDDSWVAEWGYRNQDIDMADAIWEFFQSSL